MTTFAAEKNINWLERYKFVECPESSGLPAVKTVICDGNLSAQPQGFQTEGLIKAVEINDTTWTALPATPLTDRNALSVRNNTGQEIFVSFTATPTSADDVWDVPDKSSWNALMSDQVILYGKASSGTVKVKTMQAA